MNNSKKRIAVVHLIWLPYGIEIFKCFIDSYKKHEPGFNHSLYFIFNGMENEEDIKPYQKYADELNVVYNTLTLKKGQDIEAYYWAASQILCDYLFFLNSFSVIKSDLWLSKYVNAFKYDTGIISATGSFQSHYSLVFQNNKWRYEFSNSFSYNFRKYKLFLKAFFYWRFLFKPFPNPHIRTTAFLIRKDTFLFIKKPAMKSKMDAYSFESGRNSLTNQLLKRRLKTLLIDKDGNTYEPHEWNLSKIFWNANQENLIISDNQTRIYDSASSEKKTIMTLSAWTYNA